MKSRKTELGPVRSTIFGVAALAACAMIVSGAHGQTTAYPSSAAASGIGSPSATPDALRTCPTPLGTVRLLQEQAPAKIGNQESLQTRQRLLTSIDKALPSVAEGRHEGGAPLDALRLLILQSNCLVIVDGGPADAGLAYEKWRDHSSDHEGSVADPSGALRERTADFVLRAKVLDVESTSTAQAPDGEWVMGYFGPGSKPSASANVQIAISDVRNKIQLAMAHGDSSGRDTALASSVLERAGVAPVFAEVGVPSTAPTATVLLQAFGDAYNKIVPAMRDYQALASPPTTLRGLSQGTKPPSIQTPPPTSPTAEGAMYPVWYGTNRRPRIASNESAGYSGDRDSIIHYGKAWVYIPKGHHFGSTGSTWLARLLSADDPLSLQEIIPASRAAFYGDIRSTLSKSRDGTLLIYIHGFDVTFQEAAIRAAQIGFDLDINGAVALYSWPSKGNVEDYAADEASVQAAEDPLVNFIIETARSSSAKQVDIIAHSMGNLGLVRAVNRAAAQAALTDIKFGQIFLAAPDVDAELFTQLATIYPKISNRTTLYVSGRDKALEASHWMRDFARAGFSPPITSVAGIDTIEVTNIDLTMLGHSYYAEAEDVLRDMYVLMRHNDPPDQRQRLLPARTPDGKPYWIFKR